MLCTPVVPPPSLQAAATAFAAPSSEASAEAPAAAAAFPPAATAATATPPAASAALATPLARAAPAPTAPASAADAAVASGAARHRGCLVPMDAILAQPHQLHPAAQRPGWAGLAGHPEAAAPDLPVQPVCGGEGAGRHKPGQCGEAAARVARFFLCRLCGVLLCVIVQWWW